MALLLRHWCSNISFLSFPLSRKAFFKATLQKGIYKYFLVAFCFIHSFFVSEECWFYLLVGKVHPGSSRKRILIPLTIIYLTVVSSFLMKLTLKEEKIRRNGVNKLTLNWHTLGTVTTKVSSQFIAKIYFLVLFFLFLFSFLFFVFLSLHAFLCGYYNISDTSKTKTTFL